MVGQIQREEDIERKREGTEEEVRDSWNYETKDAVMLHLERISDQQQQGGLTDIHTTYISTITFLVIFKAAILTQTCSSWAQA